MFQSNTEINVDILHKFIEASRFAYAARSKLGDVRFEKDALEIARSEKKQTMNSIFQF